MTATTDRAAMPAVTDPGAPVLELSAITAGYGRATVMRDLSLSVAPGSAVALLGPNGAGKTTVMRVAAGLIRPTAGTVRIGSADVTRSSPHDRAKRGLCLIPEGRGIFRSLTVRDNLRLSVPPWRSGASLDDALEAFPILAQRTRQVAGTMSGGQQQMLALARAYLSDPKLVLLDEVSMGLAPIIVDEIFESLRVLASTGVALLLVEQYVGRALDLADRVYLIDRGEIRFEGTPDQLDERALSAHYLGVEL